MSLNRRDVMRLGAATGLMAGVGVAGAAAGRAGVSDEAAPVRVVQSETQQVAHPAGGTLVLDPRAPSLALVVGGLTRWQITAAGPQAGQLNGPSAVAVAPDGRCFVANTGNDEVLVFGAEGQALPALGGPGAAPGRFAHPRGLTWAADGTLWVADTHNHRLQVFNAHGEFLRAVGTDGRLGDADGPRLNGPSALAFGADASLWVADTGHLRLAQYAAADGRFLGAVAVGAPPRSVAIDDQGTLFTVAHGAVLSFGADGRARARWQPEVAARSLGLGHGGRLHVHSHHA